MAPSVVYVMAATSLHGGNRVVFEHAEGLERRGYDVTVVSPEPPPDWHPLRVPYARVPLGEPGAVPAADVCVGTFWNTVGLAYHSGAPHVFHLCQGYEGNIREYAPILDQIEAAYRLPIPKLLISRHLEPILKQRYEGVRTHLLDQAIDSGLFSPGKFRAAARPLRVGVVGPFGPPSKGVRDALEGLLAARREGIGLEVHRASADPLSPEEEAMGATDRFFHHLSTEEMVGFYRRLDVLIHPVHQEEGFPLPPLEAMACGIPVILTTIPSFEVLPDDAVLRFPPGEPAALVPLLERLTDPKLRRRLRRAGRACARTYTLDAVLDRMEVALAAEGAPVVERPAGRGWRGGFWRRWKRRRPA